MTVSGLLLDKRSFRFAAFY